MHDVEELRFESICLSEEEYNIFSFCRLLESCAYVPDLVDPLDVLLKTHSKGMRFGLSNTVIEFKDLHGLMALLLTLKTMFVESELAMFDVLLRSQKNVK